MNTNILFKLVITCCLLIGFTGVNLHSQNNNARQNTIPAANFPTLTSGDVVNFYSTQYGTGIDLVYLQWGATTQQSSIDDISGNPILEFSKFNYIAIQYNPNNQLLSIDGKTRLHMAVYPDKDITAFKLKLILYNDRLSTDSPQIEIPTEGKNLTANSWNYITFDISEFYNQTGGHISTILLEGGDSNTTIYVDHIFFHEAPPSPSTPPVADTPTQSPFSVVNIYSTKYGTDNRLEFGEWGPGEQSIAKDMGGNDILKFTNYSFMGIVYAADISNTDKFYLDVYPIKDIADFSIKLILYKDASHTGKEISHEFTIGPLTAGGWRTIDIEIADFAEDANYKISAIQPVVNGGDGEFFLDHMYFYNSNNTPPPAGGPAYPAYTPPVRLATDVLSVFSDSYESGLPDTYPQFATWGEETQTTVVTPVVVVNNNILQLNNTSHLPIALSDEGIDASQMEYFHIDIYSPDAKDVFIFLNDGVSKPIQQAITKDTWNRIDIPLTEFTDLSLEHIKFVGLEGGSGNTFYIDNIYFYKKQLKQNAEEIHALNKALGKGINFGTIFDNAVTPWDDSYLDIAKNAGFEHVRLPIRWDYMNRSIQEFPYNIDEKFMLEIRSIVDKALAKGLRIIINMHNYMPLYESPTTEEARFINMWGQIAEYFQNYPPSQLLFEPLNEPQDQLTPDGWNDLLVKALAEIRKTNPDRAVLIGTADWGGLGALDDLELPQDDPNLILTIHYYEPFVFTHQGQEWMGEDALPAGVTWNDTQSERDAVDNHFAEIEAFRAKNNKIPVHIGEYGAFDPGEMDSRILWTTYISNRIKKSGYSSAFWDFHIYDIDKGEFLQPILDAILTNKVPENAAEYILVETNTLYDSKNPEGHSWYFYVDTDNNATASGSENGNGFVIDITKGGSLTHHVQPILAGLNIEINKTYQVTFNAKADVPGFTFNSYIGNASTYVTYASMPFSPDIQPETFSFTFTQKEATDLAARLAFDLGGQTGTTPVEITISDITVKELSPSVHEANKPDKTTDKVLSIFSSHYTDNLPNVTYPEGLTRAINSLSTQMNTINDAEGNSILFLSDFDSQTIDLGTTLTLGDKKNLHLNVYPGSFLNLVITAVEQGVSQKYTYTLKPHEWNDINIDLSGFLSNTGGKISQLILSGGIGTGQKLYLDHLFFYYKSDSGSPQPPTGNTVIESDNDIQFHTAGNHLFVTAAADIRTISIFDTTGRLLIKKTVKGTEATVDISSITNSIYFLQVLCHNGEVRKFKFIRK